ncbi:hypothetical protein [Halotalea alkalilenta]|uniref:Ig-like domain-containing protein n=1 Tax=Halotalea alkalilenta TaxID=376489 RepID=A0A172YFG6_9GAMM|nr:hypothetical protein [Halotalea alkalilenta]ANF57812.1 hypothetical protein A5892_10330 [Halotalea alkalilenta]
MTPARRCGHPQRRALQSAIALGLLHMLAGCASGPSSPSSASIETAAADAPQAEAQAVAMATEQCGGKPVAYEWQPAQPRLALPPAAIARGRLVSAEIEGDSGFGVLVYRCQRA